MTALPGYRGAVTTETPADLRWNGGTLEQRWVIRTRNGDGEQVDIRHDWRPVPAAGATPFAVSTEDDT